MIKHYGQQPYKIVLVHGGPGAAGEMKSLAKLLPDRFGILEPYQSKLTIADQIEELKHQIMDHCSVPITLVGYSWGAWLSFLLTAQTEGLVKQLILISSGPFEEKYVAQIMMNRLKRLNGVDQERIKTILRQLNQTNDTQEKNLMTFKNILTKADYFNPLRDDDLIEFDEKIYNEIWPEAAQLRKSGALLKQAKNIHVDVIAIHGNYDPHPYQGVKEPLEKQLDNFQFILLDKCGHKPWIEKEAKDEFIDVLIKSIDHN